MMRQLSSVYRRTWRQIRKIPVHVLSTAEGFCSTSAAGVLPHLIKGGTPCDPAPPPFRLAKYGENSVYTLVLLRHGESEWNNQNRFTGWCDVNLTKKGEDEAKAAGRILLKDAVEIDHAFTSYLRRASCSCNMALEESGQHWVPITKSWRLNERHYGALQGYHKDTAYKELGIDQELVMQMRRSYATRPPRMEDDHLFWHGNDRRYEVLSPEQLERSRAESLKDCAERILPFFNGVIVPSIKAGNRCLVVSHANTIRTLVKHIDNISDEDIKGMSIPTGIPLLYRLDEHLRPVDPENDLDFRLMVEPKGYTWGTARDLGFHGVFLGDLERLQDIQRKRDLTNRDWQRIILRNIAQTLEPESGENVDKATVFETRRLLTQIKQRMESLEYHNMLLLGRMEEQLQQKLARKEDVMTMAEFESLVDTIHFDAEGQIIEPFVALSSRPGREERQRVWNSSLEGLNDEKT